MNETNMIMCVVGVILLILLVIFLMHKKEGYSEKNMPLISFAATPELAPHLSMEFGIIVVNGIQSNLGEAARFAYDVVSHIPNSENDNFQVTVSAPGKVTMSHSLFIDLSGAHREEEKHVVIQKHVPHILKVVTKCP